MEKVEQPIIPITTPNRSFESHKGTVSAVATFPDGRRVVASSNETLEIWDLRYGVLLKTLVGHRTRVWAVAISRDGQLIASGDEKGELFAWRGDTGECLAQTIKVSQAIRSLDFSPDGTVLVIASEGKTAELWSIQTWQLQGSLIGRGSTIFCIKFSPSGELLAIGTCGDIEIWNFRTRECIANFGHTGSTTSLAWTLDGTRLLSAGNEDHPTIHEWDTSTWKQVGGPWTDPHAGPINTLAVNSTEPGTLVASASYDGYVRLWQLLDRRTIAIFKHSSPVWCTTFSLDGKYILSGGQDEKISEWAVPKDKVILLEDEALAEVSSISFRA
ncbi:WD40 repeat-like protein [Rhizopogon salebrosus TDB-379]|nr:WD40 repeat-like protein [Rhizopogon salebrosus TDB-379]